MVGGYATHKVGGGCLPPSEKCRSFEESVLKGLRKGIPENQDDKHP